jgi:hypothetical protein
MWMGDLRRMRSIRGALPALEAKCSGSGRMEDRKRSESEKEAWEVTNRPL